MKSFLKFLLTILGFGLSLVVVMDILDGSKNSETFEASKRKGHKVNIDHLVKTYKSSLNERQLKILKMFKSRKVLYPSDLYTLLPEVSTRTIRRDMTFLSNLSLVVQRGNTRDTYYLLANKINEV